MKADSSCIKFLEYLFLTPPNEIFKFSWFNWSMLPNFKKELTILQNFSQETERQRFPYSFYEDSIIQVSKAKIVQK